MSPMLNNVGDRGQPYLSPLSTTTSLVNFKLNVMQMVFCECMSITALEWLFDVYFDYKILNNIIFIQPKLSRIL